MNKQYLSVDDSLRVFQVRGQPVALESDLAAIYGVETKQFNRALRGNAERLLSDFAFQLKPEEFAASRCQIETLRPLGRCQHRKYLPWVFTEHGAIMAATILNSPRATAMSVYAFAVKFNP